MEILLKVLSHFAPAVDDVIKIVNFIKARPLNSRTLCLSCEDMGKTYNALLLHIEV